MTTRNLIRFETTFIINKVHKYSRHLLFPLRFTWVSGCGQKQITRRFFFSLVYSSLASSFFSTFFYSSTFHRTGIILIVSSNQPLHFYVEDLYRDIFHVVFVVVVYGHDLCVKQLIVSLNCNKAKFNEMNSQRFNGKEAKK